MFERFSDKSKEIIKAAKAVAKEMESSVIGTEHFLLAILREDNCAAAKILEKCGAEYDRIIETLYTNDDVISYKNAEPEFSDRMIKILKMAENSFGAFSKIEPEHILLAILSAGDSIAIRALLANNIDPQRIYAMLADHLQGGADESGAGGGYQNAGKKSAGKASEYSRDLTEIAKSGKIDPVIGREKELERVIQILSRRTKNNPCLIGEAGVGKTAIAEGLAQMIVSGNVPQEMLDKRILSLDLAALVAGTKYRGEFEERIKKVIDEAAKDKSIILFIDEIHTIIGAGSAEGSMDASNILKPYLARGEIRLIGATTLAEYRKIEKDAAFERRFQPVNVSEPSIDDTILILRGLKSKYEEHHKLSISDDAIIAAANLSSRYITDRFLPDKAIDLIDEASSRKKLQKDRIPPEFSEDMKEIEKAEEAKKKAVAEERYEDAGELLKKINALKEAFEKKKAEWQKKADSEKKVEKEDIAAVVTQWTGIPVQSLLEEESAKLQRLESFLAKRVIGQDEAIAAVSRAIRRARSGLRDPKKPMGSFIFAGPTGIGKTELSKALAEVLFGSENKIIRVDMSEFMEKHSVSKLIGSPPGYVGYDEGGQLTEKIRRNPYSVVLFDEIEKAHPDIFNLLLQVLDDGILTDAQGRKVDFKNTIIIMTSNCGAELLREKKTLGFSTGASAEEKSDNSLINSALKNMFRPEFLNRLDEIIVFHRLTRENVCLIVKKMLGELSARLAQNSIMIEFSDALIEHIATVGFDPEYGARPLKRAIQKELEDPLSLEMISGKYPENSSIFADFKDEKIIFENRK